MRSVTILLLMMFVGCIRQSDDEAQDEIDNLESNFRDDRNADSDEDSESVPEEEYGAPDAPESPNGSGSNPAKKAEDKKETETGSNTKKSRGPCDTKENREHLFAHNHEFAHDLSACVNIGFMSASLDTSCFHNKYSNMSHGCIDCFAEMTKCAADNCVKACGPYPLVGWGEKSKECKICRLENCGKEMYECSGVGLDILPDFER